VTSLSVLLGDKIYEFHSISAFIKMPIKSITLLLKPSNDTSDTANFSENIY
jgi:hypothetical protein